MRLDFITKIRKVRRVQHGHEQFQNVTDYFVPCPKINGLIPENTCTDCPYFFMMREEREGIVCKYNEMQKQHNMYGY